MTARKHLSTFTLKQGSKASTPLPVVVTGPESPVAPVITKSVLVLQVPKTNPFGPASPLNHRPKTSPRQHNKFAADLNRRATRAKTATRLTTLFSTLALPRAQSFRILIGSTTHTHPFAVANRYLPYSSHSFATSVPHKAIRQYHGSTKRLTTMSTADAGTMTMDDYQFPTHRLKATMNDSARTPLVLIACGSFSPITFLHLRMFEMAAGMFCVVHV